MDVLEQTEKVLSCEQDNAKKHNIMYGVQLNQFWVTSTISMDLMHNRMGNSLLDH